MHPYQGHTSTHTHTHKHTGTRSKQKHHGEGIVVLFATASGIGKSGKINGGGVLKCGSGRAG